MPPAANGRAAAASAPTGPGPEGRLHLQALEAQAHLMHQWLLGLQLRVAMEHGATAIGDWMFRLFRRQHEAKFLASFDKLGLRGLPDADACARYHVLSNAIGGVAVEYGPESPEKAWVRFRYPRWMFDGPALCGMPIEASRGFLRGWYAQNGVSLGNPRLGFVCVSEDLDGGAGEPFGLCGYFLQHERELAEEERLQFRPGERPPPFDPAVQPKAPEAQWSADRLAKARRNYVLDYLRNGLVTLAEVVGPAPARQLGIRTARLTGLQQGHALRQALEVEDGDAAALQRLLQPLFEAMGDDVVTAADGSLHHSGLRAVRELTGQERTLVLDAWCALWVGVAASTRAMHRLMAEPMRPSAGADVQALRWRVLPMDASV